MKHPSKFQQGVSVPLLEFYQGVYRPRRLPGAATGTDKNYRASFSQFGEFLGRTPLLTDLTEQKLSLFLAWLIATHYATTSNQIVKRLMALARYAFRKRLLTEEPEIQYLQEPKRIPRAYQTREMSEILIALAKASGEIAGIPAAYWWVALYQVVYWTGLRKEAALSVLQSDVNLTEGTLFVVAEAQKQKADQFFRLHEDCVSAIRQIWLPQRRLLFPWEKTEGTFYRHLHGLLAAAGLPHSRRDLLQRVRRTTYTYSKLGGIDAGHQLGHHSDQSAHYEDTTITCRRQACDVLPRIGLPKPRLRVI